MVQIHGTYTWHIYIYIYICTREIIFIRKSISGVWSNGGSSKHGVIQLIASSHLVNLSSECQSIENRHIAVHVDWQVVSKRMARSCAISPPSLRIINIDLDIAMAQLIASNYVISRCCRDIAQQELRRSKFLIDLPLIFEVLIILRIKSIQKSRIEIIESIEFI